MSSTPTADKAPQLHASAHRGALSPQVRSARPAADKAPRAQPTASPATRAHRLAPGAAVPPDCPGNRPWHIGQPSARAVKWSRRAAVAVGPAVGGDSPARHDAWAPVQRELAAARPGGRPHGSTRPKLHASAHHGALSSPHRWRQVRSQPACSAIGVRSSCPRATGQQPSKRSQGC